jgi:hypothetical protein
VLLVVFEGSGGAARQPPGELSIVSDTQHSLRLLQIDGPVGRATSTSLGLRPKPAFGWVSTKKERGGRFAAPTPPPGGDFDVTLPSWPPGWPRPDRGELSPSPPSSQSPR